MNLLVCGGAGFIGSNFIRHILKEYPGEQIVNYDKLTYAGNLENLTDIAGNPNYHFVQGDICDLEKVNATIKEHHVSHLINFAAESVSGNTYLPIWNTAKIEILTLEELFFRSKRKLPIRCQSNIEIIDFKHQNHKVLSYQGGIGYWMPIRQISRHWYKGPIMRLTQKWGEIEVTPNHSIYDCHFNLTTPLKNPELLGLRNINHISKKNNYLNYHGQKLLALLRILAWYLTEGWTSFNSRNGSYQFGVANQNRVLMRQLRDDLRFLGYNPSITKTKDQLWQIVVANKKFFTFIRRIAGFTSRGKFIPHFIFQLREDLQKVVLEYLIHGDGEIIQNKNYRTFRFTTTSNRLSVGFSLLLTLLKYNYSVVKDRRYNAFTFSFGGDYTRSLLRKKIEKINYEGYVYDVSVEKLQNFACGVGNIIVHNTHVDRSIHGGCKDFVLTNTLGVQMLLDAVRANGLQKMINISTDEVYGALSLDDPVKFTESTPIWPNMPYAAAKAGGDLMCRAYWVTRQTPVIVTHCSNNYGPYQFPEKLIPFFIFRLLSGQKVPIYGDGLNVRDWINVLDHVRALDLLLRQGQVGEVYNIGVDNERSNLEVTKLILKIMNKSEEMIEFVADRPGHDRRYAIDASKIKALGWQPVYTRDKFEPGLRETVEWYLSHKDWVEKLQKRKEELNPHLNAELTRN